MTQKSEFYHPENILQGKTGTGGLPDHVIISAQNIADSVEFDFHPFALSKIVLMKQKIKSDNFLSYGNDNVVDDFLYDLVPFDVNAKLSKNKALSLISDHLLKFVETLEHVTVDSQHVIKAHVTAMDIITKNKLTEKENDVIKTLLSELTQLCQRFYKKHGIVKDSINLSEHY